MKNWNIVYIGCALGIAYILFLDITGGASIISMIIPGSILVLLLGKM